MMHESSTWTELDREYPPADEADDIAETICLTHRILKLTKGRILRGQHAKPTGNVRARLEINPKRPRETHSGIFAETKTYDAIVRFSNGMGRVRSDKKKDGRGMAIKVLGVSGTRALEEDGDQNTQDFVMINFPTFPFRNVRQYRIATQIKRILMANIGPLGNELSQLLFFVPWRLGNFLKVGVKIKRKSASPLAETYWSMSAYRLGERAVKFFAEPQRINTEDLPALSQVARGENMLFEVLRAHLSDKEARFDINIQFQKDPKRTPVEDPSVEWTLADSPPIKVATLIIEPVDLTTDNSKAFHEDVEGLSFNPWHSLEAHRPIGGLNRLRKELYRANARLRRETASAK